MAIAKLALIWASAAGLALAAALGAGAPDWTWAAAGALIAVAATRGRATVSADGHAELRRHLARARRRGETLAVLVAEPGDVATAERMRAHLRCTDAAAVARHGKGVELHCTFDGDALDRDALERRLAAVAGRPLALAWSAFPADGLTLDDLLERTRPATGRPLAHAARAVHGPNCQIAQSTSTGGAS